MLSIGLFMMGLWIDAVPYVVDLTSQPRKLSVPKIHIKDLTENPNRVLILTENEIIHIMSAGANIHNTFPVAINKISSATKVYVIVEDNVYKDMIDEKRQQELEKIRNSIKTLQEIAKPFVENGVHELRIPDDSLECTRDAVIKIYSENQSAKFFFNLSGGTKMLSIGLFMMES
jgi:hypothetical protein